MIKQGVVDLASSRNFEHDDREADKDKINKANAVLKSKLVQTVVDELSNTENDSHINKSKQIKK